LINKINLTGLKNDCLDVFMYSFEQNKDNFIKNQICNFKKYFKKNHNKKKIFKIGSCSECTFFICN